jgi:hypothetical protein
MSGKWYLGTRGSDPKPWDPWQWRELGPEGTLAALIDMGQWAKMGQHVRLEFLPDSVVDPEVKNVVGDQGA